jgi:hypothetical protein
MMFRKAHSRPASYTPESVNYDLGMDELRKMNKREF